MKPSDNEIEMLAAGFAIQHKNGLIRFAHALLDKYAPQASAEDVRNAALDQAAAVAKRISDKYAFGHYGNETDTADEIEREILALKTQADKDGGQRRAGDDLIHALGECRDAFPTPDIAGSRLDLLWQEAMSDPTAVPAYVKACAARAGDEKEPQ